MYVHIKQGGVQPKELAEYRTVFINETVAYILEGKHPHENILSYATLETYDKTPIFILVDITKDAVELVARELLVDSFPGGMDP